MRIRYKLLLILGLIIITLMAAFYAVALTFMFNGLAVSETQHSTKDAERFITNFNNEIISLNSIVNDWANWDATYDFVENNNTHYITSNIIHNTFDNLQLNVMLFFDKDDKLVFGANYDLSEQIMLPLDDATVEQIQNYTCLFSDPFIYQQRGLIIVDNVPMLVAANPIQTSLHQGPSQGTLVIGRFLDAAEIKALSSATGLPVTIVPFGEATLSKDFELAKNTISKAQPFFTSALNETIVSRYVLLKDINGQPLLIARVDNFRAEYVQGTTAMMYSGVSVMGVIVAMFLCIALLLDKIVISRLSSLNDTVINVRKKDNSVRVKVSGNDELSSLGENINSMLDVIDNNTVSLENTVKERTKDLVENKKKLESILLASPDAIVALDTIGGITECNPRLSELSGYDREYLIGKPGSQFVAEQSNPSFAKKMADFINKNNGPMRFETYFLKKDGSEFPAEFSVNLVKDEYDQRVGTVGIIRDLSDKKQLEQQLLKSQRLAAIGELAGMVGHDLRNPLAAIKNADYYIKKKCMAGCEKSQIIPMLDIIDKSIEHANNIVNDLLEYSREQHLEIIDYPAKNILGKALEMVKIPNNVKLVNALDDITLNVDENKAIRVFVNLAKNAIEAMPDGGTLKITDNCEADYTSISFSDTGPGISEEVMSQLFTPLFTTKAQGMGFGLSISKRVVEAHGGRISVQSTLEEGTTFTVAFPNSPHPTEEAMNPTL